MSVNTTKLDLLLKEIEDRYVQENFYRLKLYLENLRVGNTTIVQGGGSSTPSGSTVEAVKKTMDCDSGLTVGSWVYQSQTVNNFAVGAVDNNPPYPVEGYVISKPSATQAEVVFVGIVDASLSRGRVFLGASGTSTVTCPSSGAVQRLGVSFGDGKMLVKPDFTRLKRT